MNEFTKRLLKFKYNNTIQIGVDIGGTLTKMAVFLSKSHPIKKKDFFDDFGFSDHIELDDNHLFIKLFHTNKFNPEAIDFIKSKIIIILFLFYSL